MKGSARWVRAAAATLFLLSWTAGNAPVGLASPVRDTLRQGGPPGSLPPGPRPAEGPAVNPFANLTPDQEACLRAAWGDEAFAGITGFTQPLRLEQAAAMAGCGLPAQGSAASPGRSGPPVPGQPASPAAGAQAGSAAGQARFVESEQSGLVAQWVKDLPPVTAEQSHFGVISLASLSNVGSAQRFVEESGAAALYDTPEQLQVAKDSVARPLITMGPRLGATGAAYVRNVQNLPWGLIEVQAGRLQWELSDHIVRTTESQGLRYVGTVAPYADWDLASRPPSTDPMCLRLMSEDFFFLRRGGRMARYVNLDAFISWLGKAVERYDGDGVDDMPGLVNGIKYWQIHNEPDAPATACGLYRDDPQNYLVLQKRAYQAVKAACADCVVLNGGITHEFWTDNGPRRTSTYDFWPGLAAQGIGQYIDVIAAHYNRGKDADHGAISELEAMLARVRQLLGAKPIWLTEFGVFVGFGGQFSALPEAQAGAWYVRFYTAGLASGATRFFPDAPAFVTRKPDLGPDTYAVLLPSYINRLVEAKLGRFTAATKLADGQYRFTVDGRPVYVLWNGLPAELPKTVTATDMYGTRRTLDASQLAPSEASPLFVEP